MFTFSQQVINYFTSQLFPVQPEHDLPLNSIHADSIFVPVVPLFEEYKRDNLIEELYFILSSYLRYQVPRKKRFYYRGYPKQRP
jgi:hypothetical protein